MVLQDYHGFVSHVEACFELLNNLVSGVNYIDKTTWPQHRALQWIIVAKNLRLFYRSFQELIFGYWNESMMLGRGIYEAFVACVYISCYPADKDSVITAPKGSWQFNVTNFVTLDLALQDWILYKVYSAVSHFNKYDVAADLIAVSTNNPKPISMHMGFEKVEFESALNCLCFMANAYLRLILKLFVTSTNGVLKQEWVKDAEEMVVLYEAQTRLHPKPHWPRMIEDLDYVFEIIVAAEAGNDWTLLKAKRQASITFPS